MLRYQRLRTGKPVNESLHLIGRAFLAQEVEDNAYRLFCSSAFDADAGRKTPDQLFHDPLTPPHSGGIAIILNAVFGDDKRGAVAIACDHIVLRMAPRQQSSEK